MTRNIYEKDKPKEKKPKHINKCVESCILNLDAMVRLTPNQMQIMLYFMYLCNKDNVICNEEGMAATNIKDLSLILKCHEENPSLRDIIKKDIIRKVYIKNAKVYAVNPYIAQKTKNVQADVYLPFNDSKWRYTYSDNYYEEVLV